MKKKNSESGSVLMIVTLIMIVAAVYVTTALFDVRGTVDQERLYKTKKHMGYLQNAIADYRTNNSTTALSNLDTLVTQPVGHPNCDLVYNETFITMQIPHGWCGPYLDPSLFLGSTTAYKEDAWGTNFTISSSGVSGDYTYTLKSCGEDLACGNADDVSISF